MWKCQPGVGIPPPPVKKNLVKASLDLFVRSHLSLNFGGWLLQSMGRILDRPFHSLINGVGPFRTESTIQIWSSLWVDRSSSVENLAFLVQLKLRFQFQFCFLSNPHGAVNLPAMQSSTEKIQPTSNRVCGVCVAVTGAHIVLFESDRIVGGSPVCFALATG